MATKLWIAGHGEGRVFDPGAMNLIPMGEHEYYEDVLFPAMKKIAPSDNVFFSEYNVFEKGNLAALANKYGKDTIVMEMHLDAFHSRSASDGHVVIHSAYEPDNIDLAIRDAIKKHVGIRYEHKGHKGISGRDNLKNVNIAKDKNINYRLVEFGFSSNPEDANVLLGNYNAIAKDLVLAVNGKVANNPVPSKTVGLDSYRVAKDDTLWGISQDHDVSVANLKSWNNLKSDTIQPGQVLNLRFPSRTYTVKSGDSLSAIGSKLKVNWKDIAKKNGIKAPYVIRIGQKLKY